jgi:hypothetical protein
MYLNDEKTDMILIMTNVIKMLLPLRVYANIFPKTLRFFTISFNQANDVYVKIYETAKLCLMFFK